MGYKVGADRKQLSILPVCLDDYVTEGHICRVITAFTEQLGLRAPGFKYAEWKGRGCRPYDPRMMLNLYIYGYLHRVRSSRRLEAETKRNMEAIWLMNGLKPDDKTISNFRKDNTKALRQTFREFAGMCRGLGLYGEELAAAGGAKFRANNSLKKHYNETAAGNELSRTNQKISEYLSALEQGDKEEEGRKEPTAREIKAAPERLEERKAKYGGLKTRVAQEGEISIADSDARLMRGAGDARPIDAGCNVQTIAGGKYRLIAEFEVTNCSSGGGMPREMAGKAKETLEAEELTALADRGYYSSGGIAACEGSGAACLVAKKKAGGGVKTKEFANESFVYGREKDVYTCPCGNELTYKSATKKNGDKNYSRYVNYEACRNRARRAECTKCNYREIWRLPGPGQPHYKKS